MNTKFVTTLLRTALVASTVALSGLASAATTTVSLTALRTTTTLPDGAKVPMWGYCGSLGTNADASAAAGTSTSVACSTGWSVGPTITVPAGSDLVISLTNNLPVPTSIVVLGQLGGGLGTPSRMDSPAHDAQTQTTWPGNGAATFTPPSQGQRVMSMGGSVAAGVTNAPLTWYKLKPGTYIYETGTMPSIQAPMGLYGVLIVTQAPVQANAATSTAFAPGKAYPMSLSCLANPASPSCVSYDSDVALLFSEIDPVQNAAVDAAAAAGTDVKLRFNDSTCVPNCYPAAVNYAPTYFLINGKSFDQTLPANSALSIPGSWSSGQVLVRFLNAGLRSHIPSIVGLPMSIVAEDGNLAPGNPKLQNEVLLTAGKTHDVLVSPPASSVGYNPNTYPVFDRKLGLSAANQLSAGMQGYLQVAGGSLPSVTVPVKVTPVAVADMYPVPLNTSINGNVRSNDVAVVNAAVVAGSGPSHGTLSFNADGSFVYSPVTGYFGPDTFSYVGNNGTTNTVAVMLNVGNSAGGPGAPTANADSYVSNFSSKFSVSQPGVLANDTSPGNFSLTAALSSVGTCSSVTLNANGSFTATGSGSCSFTYTAVNSKNVASAPANVSVTFPTKSGLTVAVVDPADGSAITDYRWIIQEDLTFKVDPTHTPSLATRTLGTSFHKSHMTVVASGCVGSNSCGSSQVVRGTTNGSQETTLPVDVVLDPSKNYYISILPGDAGTGGHSMGGAEIKNVAGVWSPVTINSNAGPLVPAQLSIFIYEDNAPVNNQNDLNETGLGGFNIILVDAVGRSGDPAGQQTYDAFGMPLSNALLGRTGCPDDLNKNTNGTAINPSGNIVGAIYTCPNDPNEGTPLADPAKYALAGHALIQNVTPARYDVIAHPGAAREGAGEVWWQVETLEGTPAQDAFAGVKEPRYFQEFGPPGFHTTIGFVNPNKVKKYAIDNGLIGTNTITGKITNQHMSRPSNVALWDSGSYDLLSSTTCQVALNSQGGDGPAIAITTCDRDGNFTLSGVPAGSYEIAIWDQWLDQIIQAVAVTVPEGGSKTVAMGPIPVLSWFTQYNQSIFMESSAKLSSNPTQRGIYRQDLGDTGISNVVMTTRYRDGGISNQTSTDSSGNGLLAELFPLFNWYVTEADTTRFKQSGVNVIVDAGGPVDSSGDGKGLWNSMYQATAANPTGCDPTGGTLPTLGAPCPTANSSNRVEIPGAYSYGLQGFISQRNTINWGRVPYATQENGGIQGVVVYSTTRPFDDQRYNVQTLWEPLVPRVTVHLYRKDKAADGTETLTLVDTTLTSSWDDYVNAVDPVTGKQVNMQCPGQRPDDPFYTYTLNGNDQFRCYDGWHNWNQVQAAPYDGRYQFPSSAYIAAHALTAAQVAAGQTLVSLPVGQYVVEAVTPAGYEIVKEEDKNILNGDAFVAPAVTQFAGIGNVFILPDQATLNNANPYNQNNATSNLGANESKRMFPECVGSLHRVPEFLSLFPSGGLVAPFAGMDRPLCDRKLVSLADQQQASADFFVFTEVPAASAGTGIILDDATSEFNAAAPDFGEKASVPFVPVSIKDFNGREISRSYSDQWGAYNVLTPSSWLVNPPTPSGYGPNMLVTCINDPGPIKDPVTGKMITDPQYNAGYSNFCYTLPFMPGRTTYLDTPVLPVAAFAGGYNQADCAYPDTTPGIARVDAMGVGGVASATNFGPYVPATGTRTLTITSQGVQNVPNPAYAGPFATTGPASLRSVARNYGFGSAQGTVVIGGVKQIVNSWTDSSITITVAPGTGTGELVVTAANGKSSVDAVTVTVGGKAPTRVQASAGQTIQAAIDAAVPGDLILVDAGTYNELVVMWKPVRLQGVGASSVIINAAKYPTSKLETWRPTINSLFSVDIDTGNQVGIAQVDPLPGQEITGGIVLLEPSVLGTEEGAGITVLAKNLPANQCNLSSGDMSTFGHNVRESNFLCAPSRIDGLSVTGGDAGGGIYVNGWAHGLEISNNRVYGNAGALNGGVRVGVPYLEQPFFPGVSENTEGVVVGNPTLIGPSGSNNANKFIAGLGYDNGVSIHHNAITKNGTVEGPAGNGGAGGGLSICTGTDGYSVDHNWICGNFSSTDGGGIGHIGYSQSRYVGSGENAVVIPNSITNNTILFNQSFQQTSSTHGGGIVVIGEPNIAGTLTLGTGNLTIDSNLIRGNFSEGGHGGGVRLQQVNGADVAAFNSSNQWHKVTMTNNMVVNNVAGWGGGGISLADTVNSSIINNTVASNDSVGIAGVLLSGGLPVQIPAAGVTGTTGKGRPNPAGISSDPTSTVLRNARSGNTVPTISNPALVNNVLWHNRSFYYDGSSGTSTLCANNGTDGTCHQVVDQVTTGQCDLANARYWDLGVLGETSATSSTSVQPDPYGVSSASQTTTGNTRTVTLVLAVNSTLVNGQVMSISGFLPGISGLTQAQVDTRYNRANVAITLVNASTISYTASNQTPNLTNAQFLLLDASKVVVTPQAVALSAANRLSPTYSVLSSLTGYAGTGNSASDPLLADLYCNGSRVTPEFAGVINPPSVKNLQVAATTDEGNNYVNLRYGPLYLAKPTGASFGDYHLASASGSAYNAGTATGAPRHDFDGQSRPQPTGGAFDIGADEFVAAVVSPVADLQITVTDGLSSAIQGSTVSYTIVVTNAGPSAVTSAQVADTFPAILSGVSWTCVASAGSSCTTGGSGNNRTGTVTLLSAGTATFTANTTLSASATGALVNTATVTTPAGVIDPNLANNSAIDTDTIVLPPLVPTLGLLDNFNRANANTLGGNWNQSTLLGAAALRVNANQASASLPGNAYWNVTAAGFGPKQGAAFTIANTTLNGDSLILKATGAAVLGVDPNFIRVQYTGGTVVVSTTTNGGLSTTSSTTISNANSTFINGNTLTAVVDATGVVSVWKNATYVGSVTLPNVALWTTGGGLIGMQLPNGARVDNFSGGLVP